jgi:uncharacterized protein (TIGR02145 family)
MIGVLGVSIAMSIVSISSGGTLRGIYPSKRMADGKQWMTRNLDIDSVSSYCYQSAEKNCRQYGRLYTWEAARRGCQSLGDGWRLPTNEEWRQLAEHYGGLLEESGERGKASYKALVIGGASGFDVLLGGDRDPDGRYARLEEHGFFWSASETDGTKAWFYNFGKGALSLNRHKDGDKQLAVSVRCVRD